MALESLVLDDLRWKDLVDAARRRIPAASRGNWTLHAPIDPGITILELTAWLLEQRLYWLDRVSDPFGHALAALLGEHCRSARAAATVFRIVPDEQTMPTLVGKDMVLALLGGETGLAFTIDDDLLALPVERVRVVYDGRDRTDDLEHGRPLDLLAGEVRFVLALDPGATYQHPAGAPAAPIALYLELETPEEMPLEWTPLDQSPTVLDPLPVRWSYRSATTADQPLPPTGVRDGTLGLRRSGIVRLRPGADWVLDPAAAARSYTLSLRFDVDAFSAPPRLLSVAANAVAARNRKPVGDAQKVRTIAGWLPLPGRTIELVETDGPLPMEDTVELSVFEREINADNGTHWWLWERVDDFVRSGPADRVFVVDREHGFIRFGDGLHGRVPQPEPPPRPPSPTTPSQPGALQTRIAYDVGGGEQGNVATDLEWRDSLGATGVSATNVVPGQGGRGSETIAQLHERVAAELQQPSRAVILDDFAFLLRSSGLGLRRVHTAVGHHPAFPETTVPGAVTVFIVPDVPRPPDWDHASVGPGFIAAPRPGAAVLRAARQRIESARLAGSEVFVCPPRYRRVTLVMDVISGSHVPEHLRECVQLRLARFLDPLVGGDEHTGWTFGAPIRPSALLREAQNAVGRDGEVRAVKIGLDDACPEPACDDVGIRPWELVVAETVTVRIERPVPSATDTRGFR